VKLFRSTKALVAQIDEFLDQVSEGAMVLRLGVAAYLEGGAEAMEERLVEIKRIEARGDTLRREIERQLYAEALIPESRGDVLSLLERMDQLLNDCKGCLYEFKIERPDFPEELRADLLSLTGSAAQAVEAVTGTARAFFVDPRTVSEHMHKVFFFEKEADRTRTRLKETIFSSPLGLAEKMQLGEFVSLIDGLADTSENVADRLVIFAIKRSI